MNVLVLMCDHLRYDAIGFHGNPYVRTPNLDRLAARSVRFTRGYCNSPLCGPTRHSLATGTYPYRHGVTNNSMLPVEGMHTVAHELAGNGWRTACIGHMHWQRMETSDDRQDVFPDHGYEEYHCIHPDQSGLADWQRKRLMWETLQVTQHCTAGASVAPEEHSYSRQISDASIRKLREWKERGERFLNWTSYNDPHPPFFPPAEIYAHYAGLDLPPPIVRPEGARPSQAETATDPVWAAMMPLDHRVMKAGYYGLIDLADRHLGRVLDALDELDLWKDTMVIFTVDHGEMLGDFGRYFKNVMWEQATHMPFFVCHPAAQPGECDALVEHVDIFPTLCDALGVSIPEGVQGRSLMPCLSERRAPADWRRYALAQLDDLVMVRDDRWKLVYKQGRPAHLFDLQQDPGECHDRLADQPEVAGALDAQFQRDHPDLFPATARIRASGRLRKKKVKPAIAWGQFK